MELKQIKELMAAMERAGIKKASIKEKDGFEVHFQRHDEPVVFHPPPYTFCLFIIHIHLLNPITASLLWDLKKPLIL